MNHKAAKPAKEKIKKLLKGLTIKRKSAIIKAEKREKGEKKMAKEFIYNVNGTEFTDNKAFGEAWREAKKVATEEHVAITRTVIDGEKISNEFYSKGGCFLDMETADFNKRANIF